MMQTKAIVATVLFLTLSVSMANGQTYTPLVQFGNLRAQPQASGALTQAVDGNIYESSYVTNWGNNCGAIYQISPSGVATPIWAFPLSQSTFCYDGGQPKSGVSLGSDGFLYGTAEIGGAANDGTLFKLDTVGDFSLLHQFTEGTDGGCPVTAPTLGPDGSFYGTSRACTSLNDFAYKVDGSGNFQVLSNFVSTGEVDENLTLGTDGNLYGVSLRNSGDPNSCGNVFRMNTAGIVKILYNFDKTNACLPGGQLVQGKDGAFYGTTFGNMGTVFRITTASKLTILHQFSGTDGQNPAGGLVAPTDGNLYGSAATGGQSGNGVIFRISTKGAFSVLYNFDGTNGSQPVATPVQHTNGKLYGNTGGGGVNNQGLFYSFDVGLSPFAGLVSTSGPVGSTIGVLGQGFTGTKKVSFTGGSAAFTVVSDTYLTVTVPNGAMTGFVTVETASGPLKSSKPFHVTPQILSFSPPSGPIGTQVIITGVSLKQTNKVTFGGVRATAFTVNSDTQVTATVPTGAMTGPIVITTAGGTATSATSFTVTP